MTALRIALILLRATLDELPGRYSPIAGAALLCALVALVVSAPMVWLMSQYFALVIPGMIVIGVAAQATLICPCFLLPERCAGGLAGALSGILALIVLGTLLPALLTQVTLW